MVKMLKNILGAVLLTMVLVSGSFSGNFYIDKKDFKVLEISHYNEYNKDENPKKYDWCGHGALKMAIEPAGIYKGLDDIHTDFLDVDKKKKYGQYASITPECKKGYCAFPNLLKYSIYNYKKQGFHINLSRSDIYNKESFLKRVIKEIDSGNSIIILSKKFWSYKKRKWYTTGHFLNIIGYKKRKNDTLIILRDTYKYKNNSFYDLAFESKYLFDNTKGKGHLGSLPLMIIKD